MYVPLAAARIELHQQLGACTLVRYARRARIAALIENRLRAGDIERCRKIVERVVPVRGAVLRWRVLSGVGLILIAGSIGWRWWPRESVLVTVIALSLFLFPFAYEKWQLVEIVSRALWSREYWSSLVCFHQLEMAASENDSARMLVLYRASRVTALLPSVGPPIVVGYVSGMRAVAEWAARVRAAEVLHEVYDDARWLINEERVPLGTGDHLVEVLDLVVRGLPDGHLFPVDVLRVLGRLSLCAPETISDFARAEARIASSMRAVTERLSSAITRKSRSDDPAEREQVRALHAQLRTLALTAPGESRARGYYADRLQDLARRAVEEGDDEGLSGVLEDVDALSKLFDDPHARLGDSAGRTLMEALEEIACSAVEPATADRALALLRRLADQFDDHRIYRRALETIRGASSTE